MLTVSTDLTFPLIVLVTFVELFDFVTARSAVPQGKNDLRILYHDMRTLLNTVSKERPEVSVSLLIHVYVNDFLIHFKYPMQNKMHALFGSFSLLFV